MKIKTSIFTVVLLMALAISASADVIGFGTLNYSTNPINSTISASEQWANAGTQLIWEVSKTDGNPYHYQYQFIVPTKSISHMIIEVSDTFTCNDLLNFGWSSSSVSNVNYTIDNYSSSDGKSNPNMPSSMKGIKIEPTAISGKDALNLTIWFDSYRVPVLGDFYAKSGKDVTVWNTGFGNPDSDLTASNHILRPDTVVPEPSSIMVLGMSLLSLGGMWKMKKK